MLPRQPRLIYLHGFASGPTSRKAQFLHERFQQAGLELEMPDLSEANFEHLTITSQLKVIDGMVAGQPVIFIGSSLGGYLAALYAGSHSQVQKLVLLAPAFHFTDLWTARLGPAEMLRWRETDKLPVYHYGEKQERDLRFGFFVDAARYSQVPSFSQPALIIHGNEDETVPVAGSVSFVAQHPNAKLLRVESDHQLGNVLELIWRQSSEFLAESLLQNRCYDEATGR